MNKPVFDQWKGKPLQEILLTCRDVVEESDYSAARRWKESGGGIVGHFQVYFPEEIAHAAGLLPVKICGASVEATQADSRFGSYLCSILKTSLELAMSDKLDLDLFVTHPICDAARNLAPIWGRNKSYPCQILYLPQNANSKGSVNYLKQEYGRLARVIETVAGRKIGGTTCGTPSRFSTRTGRCFATCMTSSGKPPGLFPRKMHTASCPSGG